MRIDSLNAIENRNKTGNGRNTQFVDTISCIITDCLAHSSVCVLQLKSEATKYSVLNSLMSLNKQMNRVATRSVHASYRPVTKTSFPFPLPILAKS